MTENKAEYLQRILDAIRLPFYVIDANTYRIKFANKACGFGDLKDDATCHLLTHKSAVSCQGPHICPLQEVKRLKQPVKTEHIHYDKEGKPRNMEVYGDPVFGDDGEVEMMVEYAMDVTDCRRAEEELRAAYLKLKDTQAQLIQAEKMEAVGRLASGVAHEVKNPLGIILQSVDYLEEKISPSQGSVSDVLQMIRTNIDRANRIITTLVDFSRATALDLRPENINDIVETSLLLVQHRIKLENVSVVKDLAGNLPAILADKTKIEQVFINIFLNAVQAMPEGGKLYIRTFVSPAKGKQLQDGRFVISDAAVVVIEIEDTGKGISAKDLDNIFDLFFTTKGPQEGAGLGLPVSKNIIELHKGDIRVESSEGKGTKVSVFLKVAGGLHGKEKNPDR